VVALPAKRKVRNWVAAVAVLLLLAVLTQILATTYTSYTDTIIRQQQQRLLTVARSVSTNLELYLYEQLRDIEIMVRTPGFISEMRNYYETGELDMPKEYVLSYMLAHYMGLSRVYLLDKDGNELFRYTQYPFLENFDESALELGRLSQMKRNGIGGVFEISEHRYGLSLVNIIYAEDEYLGCIVGLVGMDTLYSQFVSPLEFQGTEYLMAMDDQGTIIMHPDSEAIGLNSFAELEKLPAENRPESLSAMLNRQYAYEEGTALYRSLSGEDEINAYTKINATGGATFMVSSAMPLSQALRPVNDNLGRFALLLAILFITVASAAATIYTLQKKRQRLALQARYLQDINNTLEELHESREQVRHYQKLQTIGALAGGIVHEFNNLLTPIMGYCEFLLEQMGKDSEYADDLEEIHKAGGRAKEIIKQILPFSRRESDTSGYTAVSVDAILRDAAKTVRMILPSSISLEED
jgi:C4-dicarboxylate-specific signal transduction histidine kinase